MSEFEGKGGESFKVRVAETLVRRRIGNPLIRGWPRYALSTKDERWKAHWPAPNLLDKLARLAVKARTARRFPATAPPPVAENVDASALAGVMHDYWRTYEALLSERSRHQDELGGLALPILNR